MSGVGRKLNIDDALAYLKVVKTTLQDDREKYESFLDVMKDFSAKRLDMVACTEKVKELFKGHVGLILGFNVFLPKGYEIMLPLVDVQAHLNNKTHGIEEAITFIEQIQVDVLLKRLKDLNEKFTKLLPKLSIYEILHIVLVVTVFCVLVYVAVLLDKLI